MINSPQAKSDEHLLALIKQTHQLLRGQATSHFNAFLMYINKQYEMQWFHSLIAHKCEELLLGRIKNLMIFIPPQSGKSEVVSRNFPAYALGRFPNLKIVGCSYSADLAGQFSRSIQRIIDTNEYQEIFPNTYLNGTPGKPEMKGYTRNVDLFEVVGTKGFYKAVGIGGGLTGTPVDIAIIDDPVKDAQEAYSSVYRERVWDWYNTVLTTRLHNKSRQLFIMTRWHDDDLAGRILKKEPELWEVLSIPAICETATDGGLSNRKVGDALWPKRHSLERLLQQKARSGREFAALYQQHPTIEGGNIIKKEWFKFVTAKYASDTWDCIVGSRIFHFFLDTAYNHKKEGQDNDPTGIICCYSENGNIYIQDAQKVYLEMHELLKWLPSYMRSQVFRGDLRYAHLHIEPKANGISVVQMLRNETNLNVSELQPPRESKEVRLMLASPRVESGRVHLVEGSWNEEFISEICAFPNAPHDEYVDLLAYSISYLYEECRTDYKYLNKYSYGL